MTNYINETIYVKKACVWAYADSVQDPWDFDEWSLETTTTSTWEEVSETQVTLRDEDTEWEALEWEIPVYAHGLPPYLNKGLLRKFMLQIAWKKGDDEALSFWCFHRGAIRRALGKKHYRFFARWVRKNFG